MQQISAITRDSSGNLISWIEVDYTYTLRRDSSGKPLFLRGTSPSRKTVGAEFIYSGSTFTGMRGDEILSDMLPELIASASGQTGGASGGTASSTLTYHLIIGAGQSNMSGRGGTPDARLDSYDQRVFTYDYAGAYAGKIVPAQEPLGHFDAALNNTMGPLLTFAKGYASLIGAGARVLVVPCAYGGTAFSNGANRWDPAQAGQAGNLYQQTINHVTAAIAAVRATGAQVKIGAFYWLQGESDATNFIGSVSYYNYLAALIAGWRAGIEGAASAPFIIGQMVPEYIALTRFYGAAIDLAHQAAAQKLTAVGYAAGLAGAQVGDQTHYNQTGLRTSGQNANKAHLAELVSPDPAIVLPGAPTALTSVLSSGTAQDLTWTAPVGSAVVTDYVVYFRVAGTTAWTRAGSTDLHVPVYRVTGLTPNTAYEYQVTASVLGTEGPASAILAQSSGPAITASPADDFTRADNNTSLGNTSVGNVPWTVISGQWGIASNRGKETSGTTTRAIAVVDSGKADCTINVTVANIGGFWDQSAIAFRLTDVNNYFFVNGASEIYRCQGGGFTSVTGGGYPGGMAWVAGDTMSITLSGSRIIVRKNGKVTANVTQTFNQTATKHGLMNSQVTSAQFSAFSVQ